MADASRKLEIIIEGDDRTKGSMTGLAAGLGKLGSIAGGVATAGLAVAGAAGTGLAAGLGFAIKEAANAQEVSAQLEAVLKSTGGAAGVTAGMATDLADSLGNMTRFEDDAILAGENVLLTFTKIGKDIFPDATTAALDMSQALGQDLQSSAIQIGKALNDPVQGVTALRRVGVQLTDAQEEQIKTLVEQNDLMGAQKIILGELATEFGGSAVAAGQTFAGQLDRTKNTVLNVAETVGTAFLPTLQTLAERLLTFVQSDQFQGWVEQVSTWLRDELPKAIQTASEFWTNTLQPAIEKLVPIFVNDVLPALLKLAEFLGVILPPAITLFVGGWDLIFKAVNFIIQPFKNAAEGIEHLTNKFTEFWNKVKEIPWVKLGLDIITGIVDGIKNGASNLIDAAVQAAKDAYNAVKNALISHSPSKLFMDLGETIPAGLALGIQGKAGMATAAVGGMTRAMVPATTQVLAAAPVGAGAAPVQVVINYSPGISTASRAEFEAQFVPLVDRAMRSVSRRK